MMIRVLRFNTYLFLAAALFLLSGCQSATPKDKNESKINEKSEASLRLHLEVNPDSLDRSSPVTVGRKEPFEVNVERVAFLTEANIEKAAIVDTLGGFSISVQFDKSGGWLLEQYTTANKGKHIAIVSEFGQTRWLAAPLIKQRLGEGLLVFAPDASREEAERIVSGVNRVVKLLQKGRK